MYKQLARSLYACYQSSSMLQIPIHTVFHIQKHLSAVSVQRHAVQVADELVTLS